MLPGSSGGDAPASATYSGSSAAPSRLASPVAGASSAAVVGVPSSGSSRRRSMAPGRMASGVASGRMSRIGCLAPAITCSATRPRLRPGSMMWPCIVSTTNTISGSALARKMPAAGSPASSRTSMWASALISAFPGPANACQSRTADSITSGQSLMPLSASNRCSKGRLRPPISPLSETICSAWQSALSCAATANAIGSAVAAAGEPSNATRIVSRGLFSYAVMLYLLPAQLVLAPAACPGLPGAQLVPKVADLDDQCPPVLKCSGERERRLAERDTDLAAAPLDREAQRTPGRGQVRVAAKPGGRRADTAKAKHRGLPQPAQRGDMHASGGVAHGVVEVDRRGLMKVARRQLDIAQPRGDQCVDRRAE